MSEAERELASALARRVATWKVIATLIGGIALGGFAAGQWWTGKDERDIRQETKIESINQAVEQIQEDRSASQREWREWRGSVDVKLQKISTDLEWLRENLR